MVDAREYHERTNHTPRSVREAEGLPPLSTKPRPFKVYRDLPAEPLSAVRPPMQPASGRAKRGRARVTSGASQPALAAVAHARADPLAGAEQPAPENLDREALATLCYEAAGVVQRVRGQDGSEHLFRAASCTGNLHHVDLYLACAELDDLDAGLYHFDPRAFSLDVLRRGDFRGALASAAGADSTADAPSRTAPESGAGGPPATVRAAPVTVVATSTWARNAWKYRERTYRHAFWDAGTILANLLASAHALDYRAELLAAFADCDVADLLGVEPEREAPIALVPIGTGEGAPPATGDPEVAPIDPEIVPPTEHPIDTGLVHDAWAQSALPDGAAVAEFHRACRERGPIETRAAAAGARADASGTADERATGDATAQFDPVDPETASARPLHDAIRRRGSRREFADEGPSRRAVATVLDRALRGVPADWNGAAASGLAYNDAYVLATGVEGLDDGAYVLDRDGGSASRASRTSSDGSSDGGSASDASGTSSEDSSDGDTDALVRIGGVDRDAKTHLALDQSWAGDAHANVYLLADVDAVVEALGNRGYRLAQLEAGVALGRLYLATYAHRDLGGTGLTFYDDLVAERLAPAGTGATPTCLFAFGTSAR